MGEFLATHLFNAMSPLTRQAPGVLGALLIDSRATVEIIADGIHLVLPLLLISASASPEGEIVAHCPGLVSALFAGFPTSRF